jgi:hypothetical protein
MLISGVLHHGMCMVFLFLFFVLNNAVQHLDQLQDVFLVCDLYVVGNSMFVAQQEAVYMLNFYSSSMGLG